MAEKTFEGAEATQEDAPVSLWLDSPYQISKIIGEYYSNYYFSRHGLPTVKARFQNVYGPGEVLGAGRWRGTVNTVWRNVTPTFIYKALKHEALPVENGGIASRDFIYVGDMAQGLIACALRGEPGGVYNLASGVETTIRELAELINELTGNPTPIALDARARLGPLGPALRRPGEVARASSASRRRSPLREGLERTIAWTRENRELIDALHRPARGADGGRRSAAEGRRLRPEPRDVRRRTLRGADRAVIDAGCARGAWCGRRALALPRARLLPRAARRRGPLQADGRSASRGRSCSRSLLAVVFSVFLGAARPVPSTRRPVSGVRADAG